MGDLEVSVDQLDRVCQIRITGEFDLATAPVFRERVAEAYGHVVIDCAGLTFLDSSGIAELIQVANSADSLTLVKPPPLACRVIEALGLTQRLGVTE